MELRLLRGASLSSQWASQRGLSLDDSRSHCHQDLTSTRGVDSSFLYVFGNFKFGLATLNVAGDKPTEPSSPGFSACDDFSIWFDIYGEGFST